MKFLLSLCSIITCVYSVVASSAEISAEFDKFAAIYKQELGSTQGCATPQLDSFKVCSETLKNDGNAPYILHHKNVTEKVVVLFHGLSDSPFFFRSIAQSLHKQGFNIVVALLPGHGKKQADEDMQDPDLADRWREHVNKVMEFAPALGKEVYIGGFSTGGSLATEYSIKHPDSVKALLLFSGALALDSTIESMSKVWGIQWLANQLDGDYETDGPNPFKYPSVARFSAFELLEVIFSIRELLEKNNGLDIPIFAAHSQADVTTLISGVKNLMSINKGENSLFEISKDVDVCHADLVINPEQLTEMQYDASTLAEIMPCDVPKANPKHAEMLDALGLFMASH